MNFGLVCLWRRRFGLAVSLLGMLARIQLGLRSDMGIVLGEDHLLDFRLKLTFIHFISKIFERPFVVLYFY